MLSLCIRDFSVGVRAFVIGLSQISPFTELQEVSIEHLQLVLHANRGRSFPFRTYMCCTG